MTGSRSGTRHPEGPSRDIAFYAIAGASLIACAAFVLMNRLPGLAYFDGSEYALHIQGGGIAHAPGYPLYTLLGKFIHAFGADGFLAQQIISVASLVVAGLALYGTWSIEVGRSRAGFAPALAVALVSFSASYYLRLFAILPEVFDLNVALMALVILATTHFHYSAKSSSLGVLLFIYGLGLCHHHTLAFTIPGCLVIIIRKLREAGAKSPALRVARLTQAALFSLVGLVAGCAPLVYLFRDTNRVGVTYYRVHDLQSLLFVLLRKGYGTFQLSPLKSEPDLSGLLSLAFKGLLANYHYFGLLVLAPLLLQWVRKSDEQPSRWRISFPESRQANASYAWTSPSLFVAICTFLVFFCLFLPNCNLQLNVRSYQTIFLRFLTIPCFLLTYAVFKAALRAWDFSAAWGLLGQRRAAYSMLLVLLVSASCGSDGLHYRQCDMLDEHVRSGFRAIDTYLKPEASSLDATRQKCAIFAQGDTLLMGIKYYNHLVSRHKCFVFSPTSLSGQFLDRHELALAANTLRVDVGKIQAGDLATHPEALLNLFLKLDQQGYGLFVFSVTDYTEYFGKLFVNGPFAYRPVGNILQIVTKDSAPWGMDQMFVSYEAYVQGLETYVKKLRSSRLPPALVDSQANQALILNLADYAKFTRVYPAPPQVVTALGHRAESVQAAWLELLPRE